MNVTVLTYLEREGGTEYDAVVDQVAEALRVGGKHKVKILGIHGDVEGLIAGIRTQKPGLVFNLMEMWGRNVLGDVAVAGGLELLGVRHTGGGPGELCLLYTSDAADE